MKPRVRAVQTDANRVDAVTTLPDGQQVNHWAWSLYGATEAWKVLWRCVETDLAKRDFLYH